MFVTNSKERMLPLLVLCIILGSYHYVLKMVPILHHPVLIILYTFVSLTYIKCLLSDPGFALEQHEENGIEQCTYCEKRHGVYYSYCTTCKECVLLMDHHCVWMVNCIGFGNLKVFIQLLAYVWMLTLYLLVVCYVHRYYKKAKLVAIMAAVFFTFSMVMLALVLVSICDDPVLSKVRSRYNLNWKMRCWKNITIVFYGPSRKKANCLAWIWPEPLKRKQMDDLERLVDDQGELEDSSCSRALSANS